MTNPPPQPAYPPAPGPVTAGPSGQVQLRGRTPRRLGWIFLAVGLVILVIGIVVLVTKSSKVNGFARVRVSDQVGQIHLDAGKYLAYYEAQNVDTNAIPLPAVVLVGPSGKALPLLTLYGGRPRSSGNISTVLTYHYQGREGVAIYQFNLTEGGTYRVQILNSSGAAPDAQLAFGPSIAKGLVVGVLVTIAGVLLFLAGAILLIIGYVKRSRHKNELRRGAGFGAPPAWGVPGGYGGPPPYNPPYNPPYSPPYDPPPGSGN
jgi:uncharacterized membrane protein YidH (DUF202 family)